MLTLLIDPIHSGMIVGDDPAFGTNIADLLKSILGPIFLAVCGIFSITFLVRRQMMEFMIFLIIAILIAAIIYAPDFIKRIGSGLGSDKNSLSY